MMMKRQWGFTLVELLVVIAIIGVLSSIVLGSLNSARLKSQIASVQVQLDSVSKAIFLMSLDTDLWPNGCPIGKVLGPGEGGANNEITLTQQVAGLASKPIVGTGDIADGCIWTLQAVNGWKGPYATALIDQWGNPYWFDNDYEVRRDCPTPGAQNNPTIAAIVSLGPNGTGGADIQNYDCDDIYIDLNKQ